MRGLISGLMVCIALAMAAPAHAATGRVIKVLPHLLDLQGRHTLDPSLYERDAYQAFLRQHTNQISGIRFDIHYKVQGPAMDNLRLRVELRGTASGTLPSKAVLEAAVKPARFSHWISLPLTGAEYERFGEVTAWRVTLWDGEELLSDYKSFLW